MKTEPIYIPEIKNDFQFIVGVLFILIFNYGLYELVVYCYNRFEILQSDFNAIGMLVLPFIFFIAVLIEIAVLYESKKSYLEKIAQGKNDKEPTNLDQVNLKSEQILPMIKSQKFQVSRPTSESDLNPVTDEINAFFKNRPACKIINIEHVISPSETSSGYNSYFVCVWYSDQ
ncbi:MAG: hypothetical protein L0G96_17025 [Acinetobacter sp.]|nr:hypothetical protein [Acinetobacter sp.]